MVDHPFYREFWSSYNVQSFLGAKIAEDERHVAIIALLRYHEFPAHTVGEISLAGRYFGHLANAFRIAKYLQRLQFTAVVGHTLMASAPRPMILIDSAWGILAANESARAFLEEGSTLFSNNEVIACRDPVSRRELSCALDRVCANRVLADATTKRTAVRLRSIAGVDVLCSVWDMRPEASLGAFGPHPAALITVALARTGEQCDLTLLGSMFDLTPAEARVAGGIMKGESVAHIAAAQRLSVATVRTQLLSLFAKTGTHRQAELTELLLRVTAL
jgi:DNA-binding CsgD family transcriptional regulator